jgi:hypothetical protein
MNRDALEKIEILTLNLFDTYKKEIGIVDQIRTHFDSPMGWHYYLDLAWIIKEMKALPEVR